MQDANSKCQLEEAPRHLWEFESAWVRASSEDHARALLERENLGDGSMKFKRMVPDDEPFSLMYEDADGIPHGTVLDTKCVCDPKDVDEFGCECDAATPTVTLPAGVWANRKDQEFVIREFQ